MLIPTGFWSYTTSDETSARGKLSQLRALLAAELQQQVGRDPKVNIFQDVVAIPPGYDWDIQIRKAIAEASFMIPIITPGFLQSEWCCRETTLFRRREEELGIPKLVFPLHYVDVSYLTGDDALECSDPSVLAFLRTRQWTDFRHLRLRSPESEDVALLLETLARGILRALREPVSKLKKAEFNRSSDRIDLARNVEAGSKDEKAKISTPNGTNSDPDHVTGPNISEENGKLWSIKKFKYFNILVSKTIINKSFGIVYVSITFVFITNMIDIFTYNLHETKDSFFSIVNILEPGLLFGFTIAVTYSFFVKKRLHRFILSIAMTTTGWIIGYWYVFMALNQVFRIDPTKGTANWCLYFALMSLFGSAGTLGGAMLLESGLWLSRRMLITMASTTVAALVLATATQAMSDFPLQFIQSIYFISWQTVFVIALFGGKASRFAQRRQADASSQV